MRRIRFLTVAILLSCLSMPGCGLDEYPEDAKHQEILKQQFGGQYEFHFIDQSDVIAYSRDGVRPTKEDAVRIFKSFWLNSEGKVRDTPYGSLSMYGSGGRFVFDVHYYPRSQRFVFDDRKISRDDQQRLDALKAKFGHRYCLDLTHGLLVVARLRVEGDPSEREAREMSEMFWLTENRNRRDTPYETLCIYDGTRFAFGLTYEPKSATAKISHGSCTD